MAREQADDAIYTRGTSFRARAEAQQRLFRENILKAGHDRWGHILLPTDANNGLNFAGPGALEAARKRQQEGKGVADRTFHNLLSSQAMCFNIFSLLDLDKDLAARALSPFFPHLTAVNEIIIEFTPDEDMFGDQSKFGGVDSDVYIQGETVDRQTMIILLETKFVEPEFSICGFRKAGRAENKKSVCPDAIQLGQEMKNCLYTSKKHYSYWKRSLEHNILKKDAVPERGCPFAGPLWQLWVNFTLAHAVAHSEKAGIACFGVIAPAANTRLLGAEHELIPRFKFLLNHPERMVYIDSDQLIRSIKTHVAEEKLPYTNWADYLEARYIIR